MNNRFKEDFIEAKLYEEAKRRVKIKRNFKNHRNSYVLVMIFLYIINIWTSPGYLWVKWPALGWGLGLAFHWVEVMTKLKNIDNTKSDIEREMNILRSKMGYEKIEDDNKPQFYKSNFDNNHGRYSRENSQQK